MSASHAVTSYRKGSIPSSNWQAYHRCISNAARRKLAAIIAQRKLSTLILVHRGELLQQWRERLSTFLDLSGSSFGLMGGGKKKLSGCIDVAVMQSLTRRDDLAVLLERYGQIIVDECHHLSAFTFEAILKRAKAAYVLGLTATPIRRDGHQSIIFMQCGPVRYRALPAENAPVRLEVWPLTERTEQLELISEKLADQILHCFLLHGRLTKKQRASTLADLAELQDSVPRVILATGRLIGEGFDHPPLDTLVLAMPISWKGTLQQYAGRLHRDHVNKSDVRIYDYVEHDYPQLARMWEKRQRGYRAMGYRIRMRD